MHLLAPILSLASLLPLISAQAATQNCSVKGYDNGKIPAFYVNPNITTFAACKTFCRGYTYTHCSSFALGAATGPCLLYNVTVGVNVNAMNTSTFTFWDEGCAA